MLAAVAGVQVVAVISAWMVRSRDRLLREYLSYLVSLAVGVLLGTALLHLLPEAVDRLGNRMGVWIALGSTMVLLFAIERIFYAVTGVRVEQPDPQRLLAEHEARAHGHAHHASCEAGASEEHSGRVTQPMSLVIASMLHSFVDGATIATAFAVALHEIPHRIGDFAVFLHMGVGRRQALRYAVLEGVPALVAGLAVLALGKTETSAIAWLLPISAGSFLYIAMVSLMPELQIECRLPRVLMQVGCLAGGILLVAAIAGLPGS